LHINVLFSFFWCFPRSESESDGEEEEELPLMSEEEMNKLGAKLVKAEIMGNTVSGPTDSQRRVITLNDNIKVTKQPRMQHSLDHMLLYCLYI